MSKQNPAFILKQHFIRKILLVLVVHFTAYQIFRKELLHHCKVLSEEYLNMHATAEHFLSSKFETLYFKAI